MKLRWLVLLIAIFSLSFRFWFYATHIVVNNDTLRDAQIVEELSRSNTFFPAYGPKASVGNFYLPPLYYQIHLIFSVVTNHHPLTMNIINTFIEALTPVLLFLLLYAAVEKKFAFVLSLLYIVAPLPVIFGTRAWNPITIPFFTTLALLLFLEYFKNKTAQLIPLMTLSIAVALQLHYQTVVVIPFYFGVFCWSFLKRKDDRKYWLLGILLSLATFIPYFWGEFHNNWKNSMAMYSYFFGEHANYYDRVSKPEYLLTFLPSFFERILTNTVQPSMWLGRLLMITAVVGSALAVKKRKQSFKKMGILLLYVASIFFALRMYKGDKIDYYMSTLFIAPILFLAVLSHINAKVAWVLTGLLIFVAASASTSIPHFNSYQDLKVAVQDLSQNSSNEGYRFLFYDLRHANTISYILYKNPEIRINQKSSMLVEVFESNATVPDWIDTCESNEKAASSNGSFPVFKCTYEYQVLSEIKKYSDMSFQFGKVNEKARDIETKHSVDSSHGTDILLTELF